MHGYIEILIVDDHAKYVGRKAVLHESDASWFVDIVKTSRTSATIRHPRGGMMKAVWHKLSVEMVN